ncbi:hypothetical protein WJX73_001140 [Symbiochloris irregularis]|uniref:Protein kinase domain-containing protein n=1 Tax=Symbiochloris irregularis TaxID=706552 RepID=A0AAW1P792_9CHLO
MAVHSEDQQVLLVASSKGRSLFGLCPRRQPRVAAEDEPEITHITLPLGYRDAVHSKLQRSETDLAVMLGTSLKELPLPNASGKLKRLKPADAAKVDGASNCLRLDPRDFEQVAAVHRVVLNCLGPAIHKHKERGGSLDEAMEALSACTTVLRSQTGSPSKLSPSKLSPSKSGLEQPESLEGVIARLSGPVNLTASTCLPLGSPAKPRGSLVTNKGSSSPADARILVVPDISKGVAAAAADAVTLHFRQFEELYRMPSSDVSQACIEHLQALVALASNPDPKVRGRFIELQVIGMLLAEVSLELEMLPRGPGEAPGTPQGSTAYSPLNSPKHPSSPSRLTGASNLGTSGEAGSLAPPVTALHVTTSFHPVQGDEADPLISNSLLSLKDGSSSPTLNIKSHMIHDIGEELYDTHRSSLMATSASSSPTKLPNPATIPEVPPELEVAATPDLAKALGLRHSTPAGTPQMQFLGKGGQDSPTSPLLRFQGFEEESSARVGSEVAGSTPNTTQRRSTPTSVPRLPLNTPGSDAPSPLSPPRRGRTTSPEGDEDLSDNEGDDYRSDSDNSDDDAGLPTTVHKAHAIVPLLRLNTPGSMSLKGSPMTHMATESSGWTQLGEASHGAQSSFEGCATDVLPTPHAPSTPSSRESSVVGDGDSPTAQYRQHRGLRRLYTDHQVHLQGLNLLLKLLIVPGTNELDPLYSQPGRGEPNALYTLWRHLSHRDNAPLIPALECVVAAEGRPNVRLLRVLTPGLFPIEQYHTWRRIARGASAEVYRCTFTDPAKDVEKEVVLKSIDLPHSAVDNTVQAQVFAEVSLLERFEHSPDVTRLLAYGCTQDAAFLAQTSYVGSLNEWRQKQPTDPRSHLRLYLRVFLDVVARVRAVAAENVVHFDLKCDNVLLEPLPGRSEADVWACSPRDPPPFRCLLGDFGVSRQYASAAQAFTVRNRGTEATKAPEMLLVDQMCAGLKSPPQPVAAAAAAASAASSAGRLLFNEPDWLRFFMRLTRTDQELLPPAQVQLVAGLPGALELLKFILKRDPRERPSLVDISNRVEEMLRGM